MTARDPLRRRLLGALGLLGAAGAVGAIATVSRPQAHPSPGPTTTAATPKTRPSPTTTTAPHPTTVAAFEQRTFPVICRDAWGAQPAVGPMSEHSVDRLTLHHTAAPLDDDADAPARARAHQAYHQGEGFADLAYHFLVDLEGNILEGRSLDFAGETFTEYDPAGHFLVCCEGDYDTQDPSDLQLASVADLFAWGAQTFSVEPGMLAGHRDYAATSCPGDRLYGHLTDGSLAAMISERLASVMVRSDVCGTEGASRIEAIEADEA